MDHLEAPQSSERSDEAHGHRLGFLEVRRRYEPVVMRD